MFTAIVQYPPSSTGFLEIKHFFFYCENKISCNIFSDKSVYTSVVLIDHRAHIIRRRMKPGKCFAIIMTIPSIYLEKSLIYTRLLRLIHLMKHVRARSLNTDFISRQIPSPYNKIVVICYELFDF